MPYQTHFCCPITADMVSKHEDRAVVASNEMTVLGVKLKVHDACGFLSMCRRTNTSDNSATQDTIAATISQNQESVP